MGPAATHPAAYCRKCGYALVGLPQKHQCPECGREFDLANPKTVRRRPRRGIWRKLRWVFYPLLLLALASGGSIGWVWWEWKQEQRVIAWAKAHPGPWGVIIRTKSIGPAWLKSRAGRWAFLLERTDQLQAGDDQPVQADVSLSRLRYLTALRLDQQGVGDELMSDIGRLRDLVHLELIHTSVTDDGLARLSACRHLEWLNLCGSRVGDKGLAPLTNHPEMRRLYLFETPVDGRAVPVLKGLTKLTRLGVSDTKITREDVAELEKALPNCRIVEPLPRFVPTPHH